MQRWIVSWDVKFFGSTFHIRKGTNAAIETLNCTNEDDHSLPISPKQEIRTLMSVLLKMLDKSLPLKKEDLNATLPENDPSYVSPIPHPCSNLSF